MLDLTELKDLHEKAYNANQGTRERAADDIFFYHVSQWDDNTLQGSQLQYRGEFNILKKAGRQIMADLRANPVQIDFSPKDDDDDSGADLLDGIYRSADRFNSSIESYNTASMESVVCGFGAWLVYTEYVTNRAGDRNQIIKRKPINEANNTVFFDPNARLQDKSDAEYVSVLHGYSEDGFNKLSIELTGEESPDSNFADPEDSYNFQWITSNDLVYVTEFYHRELTKTKIYTFVDPFGMEQVLSGKEVDGLMDELIDAGFEIVAEKEVEQYVITRYIASGTEILDTQVIAGDNIPVVPVYGERAYVEGEEIYEGVTRLAKDPQRLRNFQMSYLADIVSQSPRVKPIYLPDQLQGFETMYSENGSDDNYPYRLQNALDVNGSPLPLGPVGMTPEQPMPQSLMVSIDLSRQAVDDVASPGLRQDIADPDLSGKAIYALQNRLDMQSMIYQDGGKFGKRRDGVIFAAMAAEVYDSPRKVKVTKPDGTQATVEIMQQVMNPKTGELEPLNDLTSSEFDVYADIGASFSTKKEQTLEQLSGDIATMPPGDPMRNILMMKRYELTDGDNFDDIRDYAKKQLLIMGIREPETDEEKEMLAAEQQKGQQPSAEMVLAQAEDKKAQAMLMREQRQSQVDQAKATNDQAQTQVDVFKAQTDRMGTQIDAQEAGATINDKNITAFGKQLDNTLKASQLKQSAEPDMSQLSTEELVQIARGA